MAQKAIVTISIQTDSIGAVPIKPTITVISNREEIVCGEPVYHNRTGVLESNVRSHIAAWPRPDLRFEEVCYIQMKAGPLPVVVTLQTDGSIYLVGAYVDCIAIELDLAILQPLDQIPSTRADWMRAMDDGWQSRGKILSEIMRKRPHSNLDRDVAGLSSR